MIRVRCFTANGSFMGKSIRRELTSRQWCTGHSPTVVPFTVTRSTLRPLLHNAGFLGLGAPLFEIRKHAGNGTDLMIAATPDLGKQLARKLGKDAAVVLMRGHGNSVVGPSLPNAVFRAYYTEVNARERLPAALTIGGPSTS